MRTPRTWTGSVATVVGVFVVGQVIGAGLFDLSDSHVVVSMFWVVVAAILSALWGRRVAVLFILPSAAAFVTNELISTSPVSPGFYSAASQIAPVILLALGLEEFSLRRQARTRFELVLFAVRHLAGVALFVWLTREARRIDGGGSWWWLLIAAATVAYAAVAVVMGLRLYRLFRKPQQPRR